MNKRFLSIIVISLLIVLNAIATLTNHSQNTGYMLFAGSIILGIIAIILLPNYAQLFENFVQYMHLSQNDPKKNIQVNVHVPDDVKILYTGFNKTSKDWTEQLDTCQKKQDKFKEDLVIINEELHTVIALDEEQEEALKHLTAASGKASKITEHLTTRLGELSIVSLEVDSDMKTQVSRLDEMRAAMKATLADTKEAANNARTIEEVGTSARENAVISAKEVSDAVQAINTVKGTILSLRDTMIKLNEKAENIGKVMAVINEVADQTNLLALNAAIEAARAGEAGKGFSVVADEVRKLAEKTMHATKEVEEAVINIQEETERNVAAVTEATEHTIAGAEKASRAGKFMNEIVQHMEKSDQQITNITSSIIKQSATAQQTSTSLEELDKVVSQTAHHMATVMNILTKFSVSMEEMNFIIYAMHTGDFEAVSTDNIIQWTPKLEIGVPVIDIQHKKLCAYLNALHHSMKGNKGDEHLQKILKDLINYTKLHFKDEEELFEKSNYTKVKEHKEIHKNIIAKLDDFNKRSKTENTNALSMELLAFLKEWLIKHIMGVDRGYVEFVSKIN